MLFAEALVGEISYAVEELILRVDVPLNAGLLSVCVSLNDSLTLRRIPSLSAVL